MLWDQVPIPNVLILGMRLGYFVVSLKLGNGATEYPKVYPSPSFLLFYCFARIVFVRL